MNQFFEQRMLVLMECGDGHFHQVLLNPKQFKAVSNEVSQLVEDAPPPPHMPRGSEMRNLEIKDDWFLDADLFLGLSSIHKDHD